VVDQKQFLKDLKVRIGPVIAKEGRLYFEVADRDLPEVAGFLFRTKGCRLSTATAQETYRGLEVLYHFSDDATGSYYCPRLLIPDKKDPKATSITPVVPAAAWIEREMSELFGIRFEGHPWPEKLLTRRHPGHLDRPLRLRRQP
jgi:NADH:ubiquinone oxidoreductase subunit C